MPSPLQILLHENDQVEQYRQIVDVEQAETDPSPQQQTGPASPVSSQQEKCASDAGDKAKTAQRIDHKALWVRPKQVAEVAYAEITPDGSPRHASFQGMRADKKASQVVPEAPVENTGGNTKTHGQTL